MQHTTQGLKAAAEMLNNLTEEEIRLAEEIEIGEKQGITKGQLLLCFKLNLPMEEIQKHTGLSIEEIEAFRKEME